MKNDVVEQIKTNTCIFALAEQFGAQPNSKGKCKHNPLRDERTCSLQLYRETNSYSDFGDTAGSVIDFYMKATGKNFKEAIDDLKEEDYAVPTIKPKKENKQEYMTPAAVDKGFNGSMYKNIDLRCTTQQEQLKTIAPLWVFKEGDSKAFKEFSRWIPSRSTTLHKFPDSSGDCYSLKYRYYFDDNQNKMVKWRSMPGTKTAYLYSHLTGKDTILVLEGSRDFLTATLMGYDVVALYSKNYKFTDQDYKLLKDKKCIFMDDDGETAIKDIYDNFDGDKIYFNHNKMRDVTKCESKDFSDYLYCFDNRAAWQKAFDNVTKDNGSWEDGLRECKSILTWDALKNAPEVEQLIDGFIFKQTLTVLHSKAGQGKSSLVLGMLNKMLQENKIKNFVYFDADNPMSVLKHRIGGLDEAFGDKMIYHTHTLSGVDDLKREMERLCMFKGQGKDTFVVIDTMGRFIDVMKDDEARPFMDLGIRLRDKFGATVLFIHHSNKAKDERDNVIFRGSTVIQGDCDFMWGLQRSGDKLTIKNDKGRFEYFEKINATLSLSKYEVEFDGSYEYQEIEPVEYDEEIDFEKYLDGKDWITVSSIQKHFGYHKTKDKRDAMWNMLKDDNNVILEKQGKGWKAKYLNKQPEITTLDQIDFSWAEGMLL